MYILGISAYYHDSAAALLKEGEVIACAQEERFTRKKHDAQFPESAIRYCLKETKITLKQVDHIVFYDKPFLTFERLLETYLTFAPKGFSSFLKAMPIWLKEKLFMKREIRQGLLKIDKTFEGQLLFTQHHQSHAASAFFPSPFKEAAVLCLDGVGEWATTSLWLGKGNQLLSEWEINFPHSLGLLYSAFTYFTGFRVNSGEYKLMGLAPYGEAKYVDLILTHLIDVKEDGTYRLNMNYFDFATGFEMTNNRFSDLFGRPPRTAEEKISQQDRDLARSIQVVTEEIVLKLARTVRREQGMRNLCMAGGVALNCVANGRIVKEKIFDNVWIQPAAGDAGGALGAALTVWYDYLKNERLPMRMDSMKGAYLGPSFSNEEICQYLNGVGAKYCSFDEEVLLDHVAVLLVEEKVIAWFSGRMEYGPRALGARSIIGDARSQKMQSMMNLKIKFRESFRPFAPVVLQDKCQAWFDLDEPSPYMLLVAQVSETHLLHDQSQGLEGFDKLKVPRSTIPAVTHVDNSARVQTMCLDTNPRFYKLLQKFERLTGCPVLINTSFNVRGEPIVCTPEDAFRCFMSTNIDALVLENQLLLKAEQPEFLKIQFKEGESVGVD